MHNYSQEQWKYWSDHHRVLGEFNIEYRWLLLVGSTGVTTDAVAFASVTPADPNVEQHAMYVCERERM